MEGSYEFKWLGRPLVPGEWTSLPKGHWAISEHGSVFVCCPQCGLCSRLPHAVDEVGNVHPSLVCPYTTKEMTDPPCTAHLTPVKLLCWTGGAKEKG